LKTHWWLVLLLFPPALAWPLDLCLPTGNEALLRGRDAEFFQPTVEGTVESGSFGCVRRGGRRFHEGIDIQCLQRDKRGEPIDPVHAVAEGEVAFINTKPGLSNYGRYIVLAHRWDGVAVLTLYAHLREVANGLVVGQPVTKGQVIGTLGHSSNTREGIPAERAHLHFEIDLLLNPNFRVWYAKRDPKAPPFGNYNGRNLFGLDPTPIFRAYAANRKLNFADYLARQPVAFTVLVKARPIPWVAMHPEQVVGSAAAAVAYEVGVTGWGVPVAVWPRPASEISAAALRTLERGLPVLHRVNAPEIETAGCRGLVERAGNGWRLGAEGQEWVELLTYR
jgi:murein DD-endopeptidase MepM/ murein hydrolase activator NlpD